LSKNDPKEGDGINVGNISNSSGIAIGRGAKATVTQGLSQEDMARLFATIYREIQSRAPDPTVKKEQITEIVQKIEKETVKGPQANESSIEHWLKNLAKMAPDILDVTIACLVSPATGIAAAIRKIAQKVKAEAEKT
jgi:hypothetical protein